MSNEIDYDLVNATSATHYSKDGSLFQIDGRLYKLDNDNCWSSVRCEAANIIELNLRPIPPQPEPEPEYEYEYEPLDYGGNHWRAGQAESLGIELYNKLKTNEYKLVKGQTLATALSETGTLYSRKEIKRDWRDEVVVFDGVDKCELTENLIIDESFNKVGAVKLANAILEAAGELC